MSIRPRSSISILSYRNTFNSVKSVHYYRDVDEYHPGQRRGRKSAHLTFRPVCILLLLNFNLDPTPVPKGKDKKMKKREKARNYRIREAERYLSLTLSECKVGYFEAVDHFLNNGLWTRRGAGHHGVKVLEVVHVDVRMFGQEKHNGRGDVQRCDL